MDGRKREEERPDGHQWAPDSWGEQGVRGGQAGEWRSLGRAEYQPPKMWDHIASYGRELCRSEQVRELEMERLSWIPGGASKSQASLQEGDVRSQAEVRDGWEDAALLAGMSEGAGAL